MLTWNDSKEKLIDTIHTKNQQSVYVQINLITSNHQINYLDLTISHMEENLKIQVAHHLNIEPYALPYIYGHPRNKYRTLIRSALLRATRCYDNVSDFANELIDIQLSFKHNQFSHDFVLYKTISFLEEFDADHLKVHYGEAYYDQHLYEKLRHKVRQHQTRQTTEQHRRWRQILQQRNHRLLEHNQKKITSYECTDKPSLNNTSQSI